MKSGSLFFFVAFLAIGFLTVSVTPNAAKRDKVKSGSCPLDNVRCFKEDPARCRNDVQCPQEQKCCYFHCGFKCVNPRETGDTAVSKSGTCPTVLGRCAMENPPNACENDGQCKGSLKCCTGMCGKICMAPEAASKPGKCPTVRGRCMMENPPNACENDGQCKGSLKCCTGMCGKTCMAPEAVSKPGKCPTVLGRCMMENPPNACENDGQCNGPLKCCTGMCGKICMAPKD